MTASVKNCNLMKIRRAALFLCELSKNFWKVLLMLCKNVLKVHKNTGDKVFAKYLSANVC